MKVIVRFLSGRFLPARILENGLSSWASDSSADDDDGSLPSRIVGRRFSGALADFLTVPSILVLADVAVKFSLGDFFFRRCCRLFRSTSLMLT